MTTRDPGRAPAPPPPPDSPMPRPTARRESPRAPRRARRLEGEFLLESSGRAASAVTARDATDGTLPRLAGWVVEGRLAEGSQAELFLVRPAVEAAAAPDGRAFVAKVFRRSGAAGAPCSVEAQQWRMLRAVVALRLLERAPGAGVPRVVTFSTRLDGPDGERRPWYVMPYYAGGAMWQGDPDGGSSSAGHWAEPYRGNVDRVLEIAEALATTLAAMHDGRRRVVHRDVTPGNVFFAEAGGAPLLGDFGIALVYGVAEHPADTPRSEPWAWRPPELDARTGCDLGPSGDVFMLGGLVYQALSGGRLLPHAGDWESASVHERPEHTLRQDSDDPRVTAVEALLARMLTRDPADRLPAREVARVCRALRSLPRERRRRQAAP